MNIRLKAILFAIISLALSNCGKVSDVEQNAPKESHLYPIKEKSRYGYMDATGKVVVAPQFDYAWDFEDGMGRVKLNGKFGFINEKGEVAIPADFAYADNFKDGYARVNTKDTTVLDRHYDGYDLNTNWTFVDKKGVVFSESFAKAEYLKSGYAQVKDNPTYDAAWSYATLTGGKLSLQEHNTEAIFSFNGHYTAPASDPSTGKIGTINNREEWIIQPEFDAIEPFSEGLAAAKKGNRYGYINEKGDWIYSRVVSVNDYYYLTSDFRPYTNGLAIAKIDKSSYAFIDKNGKQLFQKFRSAMPFSEEGYAIVSTESGTGLINKEGSFVVRPNLDIVSVAQGVLVHRIGSQFGAKELHSLKDIIPAAYDNIELVKGLLRATNKGGTFGFINSKGDFVINPQFDRAWEFKSGKAIVQKDEAFLYIDRNGKTIGNVPAEYQPYYYSNAGQLYVNQENGKFGFSSPEKEGFIIPATYDFATDFEGNTARVNTGAELDEDSWSHHGGKWGLVDLKGNQTIPATYELIMPFKNEVALFNVGGQATFALCEGDCLESVYYTCNGGLWGLLDKNGKVLLEAAYSSLVPFGKNFLAEKNETFSIIKADGSEIYPSVLKVEIPFGDSGEIADLSALKFIKAKENEKAGVITPEGQWITPALFDDVTIPADATETPYGESLIVVKAGEFWGAADKIGNMVIPAEYTEIRPFRNGLAAVKKGERWGFIDGTNTMVITPSFANVRDFQGKVAIVQPEVDGPEGVISASGEFLFKPTSGTEFDYAGFVDGLCIVTGKINNESAGYPISTYGVIDDAGKVLFHKGELSEVRVYPGGIIYAVKNNKWAMANRKGAMLTGYLYSWIEPYAGQELIRCNIGGEISYDEYGGGEEAYGGRWGFLDKNGKVLVPVRYEELGAFRDGMATAKTAEDLDEIGYFDLNGKVVRHPVR